MFNKGQRLTDKQGNLFEIMMVTTRQGELVEYEVAAVALKDSWFVMNSEEITKEFTVVKTMSVPQSIKAAMEAHGYYFDELESTSNNLRFTYTGQCFPMEFSKWSEVLQWLEEFHD